MIEPRPGLSVQPRKVVVVLGLIAVGLLGAHLAAQFTKHALGHDNIFGLALFDLNAERSLPNLFSTCLFLLNAALLLAVWHAQRNGGRSGRVWLLLAGVFVFLAIDEFVSLHERLIRPVKYMLGTSGFFHFGWVIPYGIATLLLGLLVLPVVWRLDRDIRKWFILSALVYLTGAIGCEMLGGNYLESVNGNEDVIYGIIFTFEESLEITGLILFTHALLSLLIRDHTGFVVEIAPTQQTKGSRGGRELNSSSSIHEPFNARS
jgi:hypothetical protein